MRYNFNLKENTKRLVALFLVVSLFSLYDCTPFDTTSYGVIVTGARFQSKAFNIKAIPVNTSSIEVEVKGPGLVDSISFVLTKDSPTKVVQKVPVGNKTVIALAKNSGGVILAKGESTVNVIGNTTNRVEVELKELSKEEFEKENANNPNKPNDPSQGCVINLNEGEKLSAEIEKQLADQKCKIVYGKQVDNNFAPIAPKPENDFQAPSQNQTKEDCEFKVRKADFPLSDYLQKQILDRGCRITVLDSVPDPEELEIVDKEGNVLNKPIIDKNGNTISNPKGKLTMDSVGNVIDKTTGLIIVDKNGTIINRPQDSIIVNKDGLVLNAPSNSNISVDANGNIVDKTTGKILVYKNTNVLIPPVANVTKPTNTSCVIKIPQGDTVEESFLQNLKAQNCKIVFEPAKPLVVSKPFTPDVNCEFKVRPQDFPLSDYFEKQIKEQNCKLVVTEQVVEPEPLEIVDKEGNVLNKPIVDKNGNTISNPKGNLIIDANGNVIDKTTGLIILDKNGNIINKPKDNIIVSKSGVVISAPTNSNIIVDVNGNVVDKTTGKVLIYKNTNIFIEPTKNTSCVVKIPKGDTVEESFLQNLKEQNCKVVFEEATPIVQKPFNNTNNCEFKVRTEDFPLSDYLERQIKEQNCKIVVTDQIIAIEVLDIVDANGNVINRPIVDRNGNIISNIKGNLIVDNAGNIIDKTTGLIIIDKDGNIINKPKDSVIISKSGVIISAPINSSIVFDANGNVVDRITGRILISKNAKTISATTPTNRCIIRVPVGQVLEDSVLQQFKSQNCIIIYEQAAGNTSSTSPASTQPCVFKVKIEDYPLPSYFEQALLEQNCKIVVENPNTSSSSSSSGGGSSGGSSSLNGGASSGSSVTVTVKDGTVVNNPVFGASFSQIGGNK